MIQKKERIGGTWYYERMRWVIQSVTGFSVPLFEWLKIRSLPVRSMLYKKNGLSALVQRPQGSPGTCETGRQHLTEEKSVEQPMAYSNLTSCRPSLRGNPARSEPG